MFVPFEMSYVYNWTREFSMAQIFSKILLFIYFYFFHSFDEIMTKIKREYFLIRRKFITFYCQAEHFWFDGSPHRRCDTGNLRGAKRLVAIGKKKMPLWNISHAGDPLAHLLIRTTCAYSTYVLMDWSTHTYSQRAEPYRGKEEEQLDNVLYDSKWIQAKE